MNIFTKNNNIDMNNPFSLFTKWYEEAKVKEVNDPNAMSLATCSKSDLLPNIRVVLLKSFDDNGFVFYTNLKSAKGGELHSNPKAALNFHWKSLQRQIRVRGEVEPVADEEADEYFNSRPLQSRIGAWVSKQSRPLENRFALEKEVANKTTYFATHPLTRPTHWSGFRLIPLEIEFWSAGAFRLHDRLKFVRNSQDDAWQATKLYP